MGLPERSFCGARFLHAHPIFSDSSESNYGFCVEGVCFVLCPVICLGHFSERCEKLFWQNITATSVLDSQQVFSHSVTLKTLEAI